MPADEIDDQQPEVTEKPDKPAKEPETVTLTKAEHEALKRELAEEKEAGKYWAGVARGGKQSKDEDEDGEPEVKEKDDEDDDGPDKLVDEFSTQGIKALVKRGVLTKKAATELIKQEAAKIARGLIKEERQKATTENAVFRDFPELKDPKSELFEATKKEMQLLVDTFGQEAANSTAHLYMAAKAAKASLKPAKPARDDERYDYDDRQLRADAQDGGGRRGSQLSDDDHVTSDMRQVMANMWPEETPEKRLKLFRMGQEKLGRRSA